MFEHTCTCAYTCIVQCSVFVLLAAAYLRDILSPLLDVIVFNSVNFPTNNVISFLFMVE